MNADFSDIAKVTQRLREATNDLFGMADVVAKARTVREWSGERKRNLLAHFMAPHLEHGKSTPVAEALARADAGYVSGVMTLMVEREDAEKVIAKYDVTNVVIDAARTLTSLGKESLRTLQG